MADLTSLEYPRHVHLPSHFGDWRSRTVVDADACAAALADGYSLEPVIVPDGEPLDGAEPADVPEVPTVPVDTGDAPIKRKPGRPKTKKTED